MSPNTTILHEANGYDGEFQESQRTPSMRYDMALRILYLGDRWYLYNCYAYCISVHWRIYTGVVERTLHDFITLGL